ncbi:MAG TPA: enolase C-terminal domain-like protein [Solirubrobacteraceae bacterium]|nr:enolase C-terminal domain-like protein [Solirubrobacteraceae bacterium]
MSGSHPPVEAAIERLEVSAYRVPTDFPESDGTASWEATTAVVVQATAGSCTGIGWTYGDLASGTVIDSTLRDVVLGSDALRVSATWEAMAQACRNLGRPGVASMAIAAVDTALWDLKARLLDLPLVTLLDGAHRAVPVYGSGGFCSYSDEQLSAQLAGWVEQGIPRVKMKVGREPDRDLHRVRVARDAVGPDVELFVDANGALSRAQAARFAQRYAEEAGVIWFEEPVSSDDLEGLRWLRDRVPPGIDIAAGEYGYMLGYFQKMLDAGAVTSCLQADVTRCGGITAFRQVAALCQARSIELSAHCGPAIHAHPCCAVQPLRHLEYFHDHARLEPMLFDGVLSPAGGSLVPDTSRSGNGLTLKTADAARFAV